MSSENRSKIPAQLVEPTPAQSMLSAKTYNIYVRLLLQFLK